MPTLTTIVLALDGARVDPRPRIIGACRLALEALIRVPAELAPACEAIRRGS